MDFVINPGTPAKILAVLLLSLLRVAGFSQISPGDLSSAHAQLEGMGNCTLCHSLGKNVANENCLSCHTELRSRMGARTGFHGSLGGHQCVECHKEHHGRDFSLVRFDPKSFNHSSIGFKLEGKHTQQKCDKCHNRVNIKAKDVLRNQAMLDAGTYQGLSADCLSCHVDAHRGQLSTRCLACHTLDSWKPASRYDHKMAKFQLTGKHTKVECAKCHSRSLEDGKTTKFVGLSFSTCAGCHKDPHGGKFQKPCEGCHATTDWHDGAAKNFDHAKTQFPLRGKHASLRCELCHSPSRTETPGGFHINRFQRCSDCHADQHRGQFASRADHGACESCHTDAGWKEGTMKGFDHAKTKFPLRGRHVQLQCAQCHDPSRSRSAQLIDIRRFERCMDCHADPHAGQFAGRPDGGKCESCHGEEGFLPPTFSFNDHEQIRFSLKGAHGAIPCAKCHPMGSIDGKRTRIFSLKGAVTCDRCHDDPHRGQFKAVMSNSCETCHIPKAWSDVTFAHERTRFPLMGKHQKVSCAQCHKLAEPGSQAGVWKYAGLPSRCIDCHTDKKKREP